VLSSEQMSEAQRMIVAPVAATQLAKALDDELLRQVVMPLAGKSFGFRTDRDERGGYDLATVRSVVMDAILLGFPLLGNAFNIIGGRFYGTRDGYQGKLQQRIAFSCSVDVPEMTEQLYQQGGYVPCSVTILWRELTSPPDMKTRRFERSYKCRLTKKNSVPVEFLTGKAERKAFKDLWAIVSGVGIDDYEAATEADASRAFATHHKTAAEVAVEKGPAGGTMTEEQVADLRDMAAEKGASEDDILAEFEARSWDELSAARVSIEDVREVLLRLAQGGE